MTGALLVLILVSPTPDAGHGSPRHLDSGVERPAMKPVDEEVVRNLELLEHLDETADLELLQELSVER